MRPHNAVVELDPVDIVVVDRLELQVGQQGAGAAMERIKAREAIPGKLAAMDVAAEPFGLLALQLVHGARLGCQETVLEPGHVHQTIAVRLDQALAQQVAHSARPFQATCAAHCMRSSSATSRALRGRRALQKPPCREAARRQSIAPTIVQGWPAARSTRFRSAPRMAWVVRERTGGNQGLLGRHSWCWPWCDPWQYGCRRTLSRRRHPHRDRRGRLRHGWDRLNVPAPGDSHRGAGKHCTDDCRRQPSLARPAAYLKMCSQRSLPKPLSLMTRSKSAFGYFWPLPDTLVS